MSTPIYLGIDIGTSVAKGTAIDGTGKVLTQKHSLIKYKSSSNIGYEHNPESVWWLEFYNIATALINEIDPTKVESIAVTGMIPNITPLSINGEYLHNGILFYDSRAYDIERELDAKLGTARWQNEVLSKLIWLKDDLRERWADTHQIVTTHSYIVYRLTGKFSVDTVTAIESGTIYSPSERNWNASLLQEYGLRAEHFPPVYAPTDIVGHLTDSAAQALGLKSGIPVVAGTGDTISTVLGAGLRKRGEMLIYYGTYNCSALLNEDTNSILLGNSTVNPLNWTSTIPRSGQQVAAFAQTLFPSSSVYKSLATLDEMASKSPAGANGVLFIQTLNLPTSTVSTEPMAAFMNLSVTTSIADTCRAILEAFGYGLRYSYEVLGSEPNPIKCYAAGGGARSFIWKQIVSDITGLKQLYLPAADRGVGSALLAGAAVVPNFLAQVDEELFSVAEVIIPNNEAAEVYQQQYMSYCDFLNRLNS